MRLIDADKVKFRFPRWFDNNGILTVPYSSCKNALDNAPTVDAVPVVRCRECVAFEKIGEYPAGMPEYPDGMSYGYCYHWAYEQGMSPNQVDGNDFCSYGKRREPDGKK